jgi:hypothetical protein
MPFLDTRYGMLALRGVPKKQPGAGKLPISRPLTLLRSWIGSSMPAKSGGASSDGDASRTCAEYCVVYGEGLQAVTAGHLAEFSIQSRDEKGKRVHTGGDHFLVSIRGGARVRAKVVDNKDGTHHVSWLVRVLSRRPCHTFTFPCLLHPAGKCQMLTCHKMNGSSMSMCSATGTSVRAILHCDISAWPSITGFTVQHVRLSAATVCRQL